MYAILCVFKKVELSNLCVYKLYESYLYNLSLLAYLHKYSAHVNDQLYGI